MDPLYLLWFLSISMLIGSFLSGLVPMAFRLSDNKSRLLALLGSGILVGTALAIIIPEGIDSLYAHTQPIQPVKDNTKLSETQNGVDISNKPPSILDTRDSGKTWTIGTSLIIGFVLMLLIDQFSIYQGGPDSHNHHHLIESTAHYSLASQEDDIDTADEAINGYIKPATTILETTSETKPIKDLDTNRAIMRTTLENPTANSHTGVEIDQPSPNRYYDHSRHMINRTKGARATPTLGLVIHAAADGIALGAAATTSHRDVEMIIFLAIMLHKAPAAFSLVVLLLHRGLKHSTIRRHLMAFSLSAPVAAMITYFGLSQSGKEALRRNNATGIAMLFSAGTFLFVATVHVLPDLVHNKLLKPKELLFLVGGAFVPLLLAQTI